MLRIAVIGAGIVGASVAFRLAKSGAAQVWVVDKSKRLGSGTTSASFAWANANAKTPYEYFELNYAGLEEHVRLRDELPHGAPWLQGGGSLEWAEDDANRDELYRRVDRLRSWGYAAEWRDASWVKEALEPNVALPSPDIPVAFFPEEAWVDAPRLANTFIELACQNGAEARFGAAAQDIETEGGRVAAVRLQGGERLPTDVVVNAAGPEADQVAAMLGLTLPLESSRGLLIRLTVEETPFVRILRSPRVNLRPDGTEYVLLHHRSIDEELESGEAAKDTLCSELVERARHVVPELGGARVEDVRIGVRPMPKGGLPCVGAVPSAPGYYEAVTHSGVTLGPLVGRLLADEILTRKVDPLIAPFRPDRFFRERY